MPSGGPGAEVPSGGPGAEVPNTGPGAEVPSAGPGAETARAEVRQLAAAPGHAVDNARAAAARLEAAFLTGALTRTAALESMLADLKLALERDEGQKLGGKSAEAARFILRAISRALDDA